jgi:hypothetical protein
MGDRVHFPINLLYPRHCRWISITILIFYKVECLTLLIRILGDLVSVLGPGTDFHEYLLMIPERVTQVM